MIAGAGELPEIIARHAFQRGQPLPTVALSTQVAAQLTPYCPGLVHYSPGQLTKIIRALQQQDVQQVVVIGKLSKQLRFSTPRLDFRTLREISRARDYRDMTL
jgi:DUF1009 family protein